MAMGSARIGIKLPEKIDASVCESSACQSSPSSDANCSLNLISLGLATGTGPCREKKFAGSVA